MKNARKVRGLTARFALQMALHQQQQGERLARWRAKAGLTQEEAAHAAGVTHRAYQRWEKGEVTPYPRNLEKLASVFGVSVEEMRGDPMRSPDEVQDQLNRIEAAVQAIATELQIGLPASSEDQLGDLAELERELRSEEPGEGTRPQSVTPARGHARRRRASG